MIEHLELDMTLENQAMSEVSSIAIHAMIDARR